MDREPLKAYVPTMMQEPLSLVNLCAANSMRKGTFLDEGCKSMKTHGQGFQTQAALI